jgi:hypothetical protein
VVFQVLGEIDRGHAARAQFFLNGVAVGEGGFEAVEGVRHEGLRCGAKRLLGSLGLTAAKAEGQAIAECRLQISDCPSPWAQSCVAQSAI